MLWCQTVISSVQGRTISTIARMSRLFGISKTDWAHSSSLPDSENPRDRTAEHMENRNKWAGRSKDRERERESTREGESREGDTTRGSYPCLQPTHCRSRFGGASAAEPGSRRAPLQALLELPAATSGTHEEGNLQHRAKASRQRKYQSSPREEQTPLRH